MAREHRRNGERPRGRPRPGSGVPRARRLDRRGLRACLPRADARRRAAGAAVAVRGSKAAAEIACDQARRAGLDVGVARAFQHEGPGRDERFAVGSSGGADRSRRRSRGRHGARRRPLGEARHHRRAGRLPRIRAPARSLRSRRRVQRRRRPCGGDARGARAPPRLGARTDRGRARPGSQPAVGPKATLQRSLSAGAVCPVAVHGQTMSQLQFSK